MKNKIQTFNTIIFLLLITTSLQAKQWSVSNDPDRPAQFSDLQTAIDSVDTGDTLLIAGSSIGYGSATIHKVLTLIGEGANNPDGENTKISGLTLGRLNNTISASGSVILGLELSDNIIISGYFSGGSSQDFTMDNIHFERCVLRYVSMSSYTFSNFIFRNCVFKNYNIVTTGTHSNNRFENCIFSGSARFSGSGNDLNDGINITNCIFMESTADMLYNMNNIVVEDCIFFKAEPTGATNSTFNNNMTYLCNDNTMPYGSNTGSGNQENTNPMFINYANLGEPFEWTHDYGLKAGSPAIGAGTASVDIGLTGGVYGVNNIPGNSRLPVVTEVSLPNSSVPINGTLQGNIKAHIRK